MSLTRNEFFSLIQGLAGKLERLSFKGFHEKDPYQWVLFLENTPLFLSLKMPFLRFHLLSRLPQCVETPFTKKMTAFLKGSILQKIDWINNDRILLFEFIKEKKIRHLLIVEFFPKRPNLYLLDSDKKILLTIHPIEKEVYTPPDNPKYLEKVLIDTTVSHLSIEQKYNSLEDNWIFQHTKKIVQDYLINKLKRDQKTQVKLSKDLERSQQWALIQHEGMLLQSNLFKIKKGMSEITVEDWENDNQPRTIVLSSKLNPHEEITRRFRQSKKLRVGENHIKKSIQHINNNIQQINELLSHLEKLSTHEEITSFAKKVGLTFEKSQPAQQEKIKLPFHEFTTERGLSVWVGKNAHSNDLLTFKHSRGSDYWLHVADFPGSHVVLKVKKNEDPDPESIQDAIQLAIGYSKAKESGAADVCLTQCKYVSRIGKNSPGKVQISKHKNIYSKFDLGRFQAIKDRKKASFDKFNGTQGLY